MKRWFHHSLEISLTQILTPKHSSFQEVSESFPRGIGSTTLPPLPGSYTVLSGCLSIEMKELTWDLMALHWTAHVLCASLSRPSHLSWKNSANSCLLITAHRERREILWETPCIPTVKTNKAPYLYVVLPCLSKRNSVKQPDLVRNVPAYGRRVGLDDF